MNVYASVFLTLLHIFRFQPFVDSNNLSHDALEMVLSSALRNSCLTSAQHLSYKSNARLSAALHQAVVTKKFVVAILGDSICVGSGKVEYKYCKGTDRSR